MSDYNLSHENRIKETQYEFLTKEVVDDFNLTTNEELFFNQYAKDILSEYDGSIKPLFQPIPLIPYQLPWVEDIEKNYREITEDIDILNNEQNKLGQKIVDSFNFVESEKKRLFNRIDNLGNLTGDLNLISSEINDGTIYIKESFQSLDGMDSTFGADSVQKVNLLTKEGIITLGDTESVDISKDARVAEVSGNGTPGVDHLIRKITIPTGQNTEEEVFVYISNLEREYHAKPDNLLDGRPDTIFEYQMVNVPESFKAEHRYYDFEWTKGAKENDMLRLKLVFDLGSIGPLNWITLVPFFSFNSNGRMIVNSIKTSLDGFEFEPIYHDREFLYQELSDAQSSKELNDLFSGNTSPSEASYSGKGVWLFPEKQARYVEIIIDQDQSYNELLGHSSYYVTPANDPNHRIYIPAPEELKDADPGEYVRVGSDGSIIYNKKIEPTTEGWRYGIGLRDVHFMRYTYSEKSIYTSKLYTVDKPIQKVVLYANEIIPFEYQDIVENMNDWVVYEISFDDFNWYRISPMHHEPVNDYFPAKIIEINGNLLDNDMSFELHKQYIKMDKAPTQVRFRITLSRPEDFEFRHTTPIVHDVALKIEKQNRGI